MRDWGGGSGMRTHSSSKRTARGVSRRAEVDMIVCGQEKTEGREEMRMKRGNWTLRGHGAMVIRTVSSL